jgi:hypothetical protein
VSSGTDAGGKDGHAGDWEALMSIVKFFVRPALAGVIVGAAVTAAAAPAQAQTAATVSPATTVAPVTVAEQPATAAPSWALLGGYERDSHGSSYGFIGPAYVSPVRPGLAWTARLFGSYLTYEFSDLSSTTEVRSPGASASVGLRFGERNTFTVMAGPAVAWRTATVTPVAGGAEIETSETRWGANVGAEAYLNPTTHSNVQGLVNYNTTDKYLWSRAAFKQQITNLSGSGTTALSLGVEGIAQGNDDIRSLQGGGLLEVAHTPSAFSVTFRAGYKRSTYEVGPSKTGPYFGVGFYKAF